MMKPATWRPHFCAGSFQNLLLMLLLPFWSLTSTQAQTTPTAPAAGTLLTPSQFLGYPLGGNFTPHSELLRYVDYVVQNSGGRMRLQPYGRTYENRPLEVVQIASPENLSRLDEIRRNNLRRAGLESGAAKASDPAIVWLSYNIHGNEAVSSEAMMQVLYDLANPQNQQTQQWLQNTVVLLDPCVNPDGRERYAQWYNRVRNRTPNASPYAWEHHEPWPGGRFNHYYFDLNRDWAWQTQQESQQRVALYSQWLPQVHADFHEMGVDNPYYFSPAAKPFHADITPFQREFQNTIGEYNRKVFDQNNWLYFTRETYDLFYPSYGDTYPSFNGAIGMTYEQGGSGRAGVQILKSDGDTLTLGQRISHHHAASLATIQATSERHDPLVREFEKYYTTARTKPGGDYKTYVLAASNDPGQLETLRKYLERQQISYGYAPRKMRTKGFNFASGKNESVEIQPRDLVISMYQPKSTLVKVLFEPKPALEDSLTYDITAWALPYAYGLQAYALKEQLKGSEPSTAKTPATPVRNAAATGTPYAYVARWTNIQDLRFLSQLLQKKVKVRVAELPFEAEGQKYQAGTLVITRTGNENMGSRFDQIVRAQADSMGVMVQAVRSGFSTTGADFGSSSVRYVKQPTVGLVAGEGISPTAFGEIWHFFEQQIGYPVTVIGTDYLSSIPLQKFDVLILPDGNYADIYPEKSLENLKAWVRAGGKLIAMEGAAAYLANRKDFLLKTKPTDTAAAKKTAPYAPLRRYADAERRQIEERVQGSVYRVQLDNTHPLAFGYGSTYYALVRDTLNYRFLGDGGWNVGILKKDGSAAGFTGRRARQKLTDTFVLGTQEMGRGQVIYLADNPLFRGFWQGGKLLFGNALFFVGQ
ncbi:M14 family metallopeptidase [Hymenobacter radiodurans]|uniref:M14 family metallopeptidase n=1 Tax=Hymenobacter radiodurans TaxID=2496028 RepID=UPI001F114A33|nr:M14 family metallopeptidase [Hymenobacter radiodurans]